MTQQEDLLRTVASEAQASGEYAMPLRNKSSPGGLSAERNICMEKAGKTPQHRQL